MRMSQSIIFIGGFCASVFTFMLKSNLDKKTLIEISGFVSSISVILAVIFNNYLMIALLFSVGYAFCFVILNVYGFAYINEVYINIIIIKEFFLKNM
jgi:hypothetical protein